MMFNYVMILLHEPCLHLCYPPDLFKLPYMIECSERGHTGEPNLRTASSSQCVASAHALCELFQKLHVNDIRSLPNHLFNRTAYALTVLVKTALLDNTSAEPSSSITYQDTSRAGPYSKLCLINWCQQQVYQSTGDSTFLLEESSGYGYGITTDCSASISQVCPKICALLCLQD